MTRDELLDLFDRTMCECKEIMYAKNQDYAHGDDPFANFMACEILGVPAEIGILMRSMDKFKRIESFVKNGELQVKAESVEDAIQDVINYMVLLRGIIINRMLNTETMPELPGSIPDIPITISDMSITIPDPVDSDIDPVKVLRDVARYVGIAASMAEGPALEALAQTATAMRQGLLDHGVELS